MPRDPAHAQPPGAAISYLYGVSCTAASSCTAVGSYYNSANVQTTLAEYWDGSTWTIQATPTRFRKGSQLLAVSCTAPGRCTAVGSYFGPGGGGGAAGRALLGRYLAGPANPGPIRDDRRQPGRNLVQAAACRTAVGDYPTGPGNARLYLPVAEYWDGSTWRLRATASPAGHKILGGISCTSAGSCTAVGWYRLSPYQTLAKQR